jgi:hypothetical protein
MACGGRPSAAITIASGRGMRPALARCDCHHVIPKKQGRPTSLANLRLLCRFRLICVHRWGWQLTAHDGGILEARSPDGTITYRSHNPSRQPSGIAARRLARPGQGQPWARTLGTRDGLPAGPHQTVQPPGQAPPARRLS